MQLLWVFPFPFSFLLFSHLYTDILSAVKRNWFVFCFKLVVPGLWENLSLALRLLLKMLISLLVILLCQSHWLSLLWSWKICLKQEWKLCHPYSSWSTLCLLAPGYCSVEHLSLGGKNSSSVTRTYVSPNTNTPSYSQYQDAVVPKKESAVDFYLLCGYREAKEESRH